MLALSRCSSLEGDELAAAETQRKDCFHIFSKQTSQDDSCTVLERIQEMLKKKTVCRKTVFFKTFAFLLSIHFLFCSLFTLSSLCCSDHQLHVSHVLILRMCSFEFIFEFLQKEVSTVVLSTSWSSFGSSAIFDFPMFSSLDSVLKNKMRDIISILSYFKGVAAFMSVEKNTNKGLQTLLTSEIIVEFCKILVWTASSCAFVLHSVQMSNFPEQYSSDALVQHL